MFACEGIARPHAAPPPLAESEGLRNRLGVTLDDEAAQRPCWSRFEAIVIFFQKLLA